MNRGSDETTLSNHERYYFGPSRLITKRIHLISTDGTLDFTITGGNAFQPIQVASVVWASAAYSQGMRPGDQIISVNGISFQENINYTKALQILYSTNELDIIIRSVRINSLDATLYEWYDPVQQRSTSPPPGSYLSIDAQLPYFERTVTVNVEKGKRLGLVIRGGAEYGLGIFISGVDKGSLSDHAGLCVGDQILSVNGIDFRHITHTDAVQLLRNFSQLAFHLRQINKLPKPRENVQSLVNKSQRSIPRILSQKQNKINSDHDQSYLKYILNVNDQNRLKNTFQQYLQYFLHIDQLVQCLLQILMKQHQQYRHELIESVRKHVQANDLDHFDISILKDDLNSLKLSHERLIEHSLSPSRISSHSPIVQQSKSVENLSYDDDENLIRPRSLLFNEMLPRSFDDLSTPNEKIYRRNEIRSNFNSLRKTKSLHNVDEDLTSNKSQVHLTFDEKRLIEEFLQDYSPPYPITIHKVRPTLGVAIEGGFQDRIPLPRVVYIQPDGCAYISSGLRVGHVVIAVNGYSMKGLSHRDAALFIASAFKDKNASHINLTVVEPLKTE